MAVVGLCCVIVKVGVSQQYYINSKTATFILKWWEIYCNLG